MNNFYTRKGDDGLTTWLGKGRIKKYDLRMETLGAVEEASASLGVARGLSVSPRIKEMVLHIQRDMSGMMAEVAADPAEAARFRTVQPDQVTWLEEQSDAIMQTVKAPDYFVMPGDTPASGSLDLARAVVRRAERRVIELTDAKGLDNPVIIAYLNRLSSVLFVMELFEIQAAGLQAPSQAIKKSR
jgi:cob(I)alamin adenosyltransferase